MFWAGLYNMNKQLLKKFLDMLGWVAFAYLVLYFLMKALGIFKSPITADVAAITSAAYILGKQVMKIDMLEKIFLNELRRFEGELDNLSEGITDIKSEVRKLGNEIRDVK